jgi:hypothetical protein
VATPAKRWPTNAEWARMDCITLARQGRKRLLEELERVDDPALLRRMAKAIESFREIESKLTAVGPKM